MLQPSEKALLDVVLGVTGDDEVRIEEGITQAIGGIRDGARRTYLRNTLRRAAKARIRAARKKVERQGKH